MLYNASYRIYAGRECKQRKSEYLQIAAELDRLGFISQYYTIEIGCLRHCLKGTVTSVKQVSNQSLSKSKASLDRAAAVAFMISSQRIFLARSNPTWIV